MKWEKPDEEGLVKFMCETNGFQEDRIRNGAKKLLKARQGSTQGRLDSFFKVSSAALLSDQIAKLYTIPYVLLSGLWGPTVFLAKMELISLHQALSLTPAAEKTEKKKQ